MFGLGPMELIGALVILVVPIVVIVVVVLIVNRLGGGRQRQEEILSRLAAIEAKLGMRDRAGAP